MYWCGLCGSAETSDPLELGYRKVQTIWNVHWEPNSGLLLVQPSFLTTEPSLWSPTFYFYFSLFMSVCVHMYACMLNVGIHVHVFIHMCMHMTQMHIYKHLWVPPTYTCKSLYTCAGRSQKSVISLLQRLPSLWRHSLLLNLDLAECFRDLPVSLFPSHQSGITGTNHHIQLFIQAKFLGKYNRTRNGSQ